MIIDDVRADSLYDRDMARIRNQKLGFISKVSIYPSLNVLDNVAADVVSLGKFCIGQRKRSAGSIEKVRLTHPGLGISPRSCPGTMPAVAIARALIGQPK